MTKLDNGKQNIHENNSQSIGLIRKFFRIIKNIIIIGIFAGIVFIVIDEVNSDDVSNSEKKSHSNREYLDSCLSGSKEEYWKFVKLNKTGEKEGGVIGASHDTWDRAQKQRAYRDDLCFRRYK